MDLKKSLASNSLIKLLKSISEDEWKDFEKFVNSPCNNGGRNYSRLLSLLKKYHPDYDSQDFTKENMYKKLFPGKAYKDSVLNSMISRMYSIAEEYLIVTAMRRNEDNVKERLLIGEMRRRGISLKTKRLIEEITNHFDNKKFTVNDFVNLKELKIEIYQLLWEHNENEQISVLITDIIKLIQYSFLVDVHIYMSMIYSMKSYWKEDFDQNFLNAVYAIENIAGVFEPIRDNDFRSYVPMRLLYLSYMATRYPENDEYYFEMKSLFTENTEMFDITFKEIILHNLSSICVMKMISGRSSFKNEAFDIRRKLMEEKVFLVGGKYMTLGNFRSTFLDAINVNETEWAEMFSTDYLIYLHPDFREQVSCYCRAILSFTKKDYDNALGFAAKVNFDLIFFKLDIKNYMCRIYYETNSIEPLHYLIETYYQLTRNTSSRYKEYLVRHRNFLKYMKRLLKIAGRNKTELEILKKEIENENVAGRSWILGIINEKLS